MSTTIPAGYTKLNYVPVNNLNSRCDVDGDIDSKNQLVMFIDGEWYGKRTLAPFTPVDLRDVIVTIDGLNRVDFLTDAVGPSSLPRMTLTFSGDAGPEHRCKGIIAFLKSLQVAPHANLTINENFTVKVNEGLRVIEDGLTDFLTALDRPGYLHTHYLNETIPCLCVSAMLVQSVILTE